jgi:hypothetical protein
MLYQKMNDPLHVDDTYRTICLVHDRKTPITVLRHSTDRQRNRIGFLEGERRLVHLIGDGDIQVAPVGQNAEDIALGEDSYKLLLVADKQ